MNSTWLIVGTIALITFYLLFLYNSLVAARVRVLEAFSHIDVQLKRRIDLIPNLIESVKGYVKHEKEVLENVTKARTSLMKAKSPAEKAESDNMLTDTLKSLFAVAENYPNLKANENFLRLSDELSDTENKIAYARQFYNSTVMDFNTKIQIFPNVIISGMLGFKSAEFFQNSEREKGPVKVSF
ncbi:MAG: LemA family protein [Candidatus Levybacteria bacterium]|nr:LemA family protein [Candidatus Levybacteria bacterium]